MLFFPCKFILPLVFPLQQTICFPQGRILLHVVHHPQRDAERQRGEGQGEGGTDDDNDHGVVGVRVLAVDDNLADEVHEGGGHVVAAKGVLDTLAALVAHALGLGLGEEQGLAHDGGPGEGLVGVAQPAGLALDDGFGGPAGVGGEDGHLGEHGLEGHDAKVLVGGGVDEEGGGAEQLDLELVGDGEEEEHRRGGVGGLAHGRVVGRVDGVVGEVELVGERLELAVVLDVLGDAAVVAAGEDQADALALVLGDRGKGADGEANVLFALEAIDGEQDAVATGEERRFALAAGQLVLLGLGVDAGVDDAGGRVLEQLRPGQLHDALGEV